MAKYCESCLRMMFEIWSEIRGAEGMTVYGYDPRGYFDAQNMFASAIEFAEAEAMVEESTVEDQFIGVLDRLLDQPLEMLSDIKVERVNDHAIH